MCWFPVWRQTPPDPLILLAPIVGVSLSPVICLELLLLAFLISFTVTSLGVIIATRMQSMQGFQMIMNFLVMPRYFLSGAMFPLASAPAWMKSLMTIDPLTYGVDALRNVLYSGTTIQVGGMTVPLAEMARRAGLVRWDLGADALVMAGAALLLASAAAYRFNRTE